LPYIEVRIKSKHLENKGYIAVAGAFLAHIFAIDVNFPRGWQFQPGDHPQGGGFTATRGAKKHEKLTVLDGETRRLHGGKIAKIFA